MKSGDFSEAARQILAGSEVGTEVWISDTINNPHQGHTDGYHAVLRADGSVNLTKFHN